LGLNGIMSSALSALQTNTAALRVVANNISNVNTADYARRQVNLETLSGGGELAGVQISDITRVVDQFLNQEQLSASSSASRYDVQSTTYDQISALLGSPGDGTALTSQLSNIFTALGQAALSPTTPSSQDAVVTAMNGLATSISQMSDSISGLQTQIDSQVSNAVSTVNSLTKQISDLNNLIKLSEAQGNTDSAYLDQRDTAVSQLAQEMDIRSVQQSDGSVLVTTQDGVNLVGATYAQLSYTAGQNGSFSNIQIQDTDPRTGSPIGNAQALDPHLNGGEIKGMIETRDGTLQDLKNELGTFAQGVALSFNKVSNANSAYPPPQSLSGRNTGLLAGDALNFTGKTDIIITDSSGQKLHTVSLDFGDGTTTPTIQLDNGSVDTFASNTVGGLAAALNSKVANLATFQDGKLTLTAGADQGLVVADPDSSDASSRGGTGFSQFFGLNDIFQASAPSITTTGVSGSDDIGLVKPGSMTFVIKGPDGKIAATNTVNVGSPSNGTEETFSQFAADVDGALGTYGHATLNPDGSMSVSLGQAYSGYSVQVVNDTTSRGTTGTSLSQMFGLGSDAAAQQAVAFSVNPAIVDQPALLAFAKANYDTANSTWDTQVVGSGDSTGLLALQNLATSQQTFSPAGTLGAQTTTLVNYAAAFYQDVATRTSQAKANQTTQDDRLAEAQTRMSDNSGVSLDEELSNMMMYQQAYSAGARILTIVGQLYDTLLQTV